MSVRYKPSKLCSNLSNNDQLMDDFADVLLGGEQVDARPRVLDEARPRDDGERRQDPTPLGQCGQDRLQKADFRRQVLRTVTAVFVYRSWATDLR